MQFPPPTPLEQATPARIKPGKRWYWIGAILLAVGLIGGITIGTIGVVRLVNTIDDFGRFKVEGGSGQASVEFAKSGKYSIYYESKSRVCADITQSTGNCQKTTVRGSHDPPAGLTLTLANASGPLTIKGSTRSFDYDFGDFSGKEIATVQVDQPGTYTMTVQSQGSGDFVIALGKGIVSSVLPWLAVAALVGLVGVVLGLVAIIVTAVKRGRRKRAARAAEAAYGPYGAAPAPAPYYGTAYPPTQTYGSPVPGAPPEGYGSPAPSPYAPQPPSPQPSYQPTVPVPVAEPEPTPAEPVAPPVAAPAPAAPERGGWAPPPPPAAAPSPGPAEETPAPGSPLPPPPPPGGHG